MDDPGSLANLHDLAVAPPVSFWPPAPGATILLLALGACLAVAAWQLAMRYRANAFRRQAAREIMAVDPASAEASAQILAILKRVALVVRSRSEVAPLTGEPFARFLSKTGAIEDGMVRRLTEAAFDPRGRVDPADIWRFASQAIVWLRRER